MTLFLRDVYETQSVRLSLNQQSPIGSRPRAPRAWAVTHGTRHNQLLLLGFPHGCGLPDEVRTGEASPLAAAAPPGSELMPPPTRSSEVGVGAAAALALLPNLDGPAADGTEEAEDAEECGGEREALERVPEAEGILARGAAQLVGLLEACPQHRLTHQVLGVLLLDSTTQIGVPARQDVIRMWRQ